MLRYGGCFVGTFNHVTGVDNVDDGDLCVNSSSVECQHRQQPAGSGPERLQAGGQREGVVGLPEDPPAPSHHLRHPPVQPRWVMLHFFILCTLEFLKELWL